MKLYKTIISKIRNNHIFIKYSNVISKYLINENIAELSTYKNTDYGLLLISAITGILIGLFIVVFHQTMELAESIFLYLGFKASDYIKWHVIVIPIITSLGGLIIGILKKFVFFDVNIEGLDSVVKSLVYNEGRIDWRNSLKSILYAALSIGSGGAGGREGPTIVLGSSVGSAFAQLLKIKPENIRVMCGSGAAAAISGIFNAPLGGIVFALEAIIGDVGIKAFVPIVISSVLSTATARLFLGNNPLLITPEIFSVSFIDYFYLAIAGILCGFVSIYYLKSYKYFFKKTNILLHKLPLIIQPAIGGFAVGVIVVFLPTMLETTYNPINSAISWNSNTLISNTIVELIASNYNYLNFMLLAAIVAMMTIIFKPITNAITLSSGGAGGTFAPAIKAGAMFGFCFGYILHYFCPDSSPALYVLVCAGAVLSGTYQLPLAGGIIIFEISRNYELLLPLVFASIFSSFIVQKWKIHTFNPLQAELVDDENKLHPVLKHK